VNDILSTAQSLRENLGENFQDHLTEALFTDAAQIADRAVVRPGERARFDLDRSIDRIVTSRTWGFPMMILLLTAVFWITIQGANIPR
jgi:ferrous iron transport protein B